MSGPVRFLRFARVAGDTLPLPAGTELVARVMLDEQPAPAGHLVRTAGGWQYLLAGGQPSGLSSAFSRQDLEQQVRLYYFGALPEVERLEPALPLAM